MQTSGILRRVKPAVVRFLADENGQDLMEYVLLTLFIGLAGLAALNAVGVSVGTFYRSTNSNVNLQWQSPNPSGS